MTIRTETARPLAGSAEAPPPFPPVLEHKLTAYRRRLWVTKTLEAALAALAGFLVAYLAVFALDRVVDTPAALRAVLLALGLVGGVLFLPVQVARWVGGHASLLATAKRVAREDLVTGDPLLGVLELTRDRAEFARSPELARAAIQQGADTLADKSLDHTLPRSRHKGWGAFATLGLVATVAGFALVPQAAGNALQRMLMPFGDVERFTFTRFEPHASELVVARHEPFAVAFTLDRDTDRAPADATLSWDGGPTLEVASDGGVFDFQVPALIEPVTARLRAGDYRGEVLLSPVDRPEISDVRATITLPDYLELPTPLRKDVRSGSVGLVAGSSVAVEATLTRELDTGSWTAASAEVDGARLVTESYEVHETTSSALTWTDVHGLQGSADFPLALRAREDDTPTVVLQDLQRDQILLHDQLVSFTIQTSDDFGVREVGLEWRGAGQTLGNARPAQGEKRLAVGEADSSSLEALATLHPLQLDIDPQTIELRAWALDSKPGRERAYSAPVVVHVMTEDDHMIWLTRELGRWFDQAVEVRDREHDLLTKNEELLDLPGDALAKPDVRRQLQNQAAAERANSRRLDRLVDSGSELLAQAARNPQFNSNTLDDWAEMMAALEDIADNRMPSVADLLTKSAEAAEKEAAEGAGGEPSGAPSDPSDGEVAESSPGGGESKPSEASSAESQPGEGEATPGSGSSEGEPSDAVAQGESTPGEAQETPEGAGPNRDESASPGGEGKPANPIPSDPTVSDVESALANAPGEPGEPGEESDAPPPPASLTLPTTTVMGGGADQPPGEPPPPGEEYVPPSKEELAAAVEAQRALMEEFQRVAGEINEILSNLEGSTFVKRLKALSRAETGVADELDQTLTSAFGVEDEVGDDVLRVGLDVEGVQEESGMRASQIRRDLAAYVDRQKARGGDFGNFQTVYDEMGDVGVAREMVAIGDLAVIHRGGEALAAAENLADHLDRWAEILVGPG